MELDAGRCGMAAKAYEPRMCSKCGGPIPGQRLEALPETRCCVGCSCERCREALDVDLDGPEMRDMVASVQGVPSEE